MQNRNSKRNTLKSTIVLVFLVVSLFAGVLVSLAAYRALLGG